MKTQNKMLLVASLFLLSLSACSSYNTPTPYKLSRDVEKVPPSTVISVTSVDSYQIPQGSQIIERSGLYKAVDNVYDAQGYKVLIPRDSIITGTYKNDGVSCSVTWGAVYINREEYNQDRGSFSLSKVTQPSICDPIKGVKSGNRLTITFNKDSMNMMY
jgi:hypothetical protein